MPDDYPSRVPDERQEGIAEPDGFGRLWTPHRMAYIDAGTSGERAAAGCPFDRIPTLPDAEGLVVARGETCYVVLNLFPYNPGHLMVVPFRHVADYTELSAVERVELGELTATALDVLRGVSAPAGFNVGLNLGATAGAGVAEHLHQHVVPRWAGDTNFMPVVGHTRVLPQLLADTRQRLADAWPPG
ncbi:MAG: HIT family protein [Mycobacteriales bacterium]